MGTLHVIVGAQFGSEGKGHVTQRVVERCLDQRRNVFNIRVAGPNAGHTVIDADGNRWPMRQIPVGFAADPVRFADDLESADRVRLGIAAGSEIDLEVLLDEIHRLTDMKLLHHGQLTVDSQATLLIGAHKAAEDALSLSNRFGSTGKGVGVARAERIIRRAQTIGEVPSIIARLNSLGVGVADVSAMGRSWLRDAAAAVVVEGTQGYGLGLHSGFYPHTTSSDCRAIDFLSMAGLPPWERGCEEVAVWLTMRPHPIRVAGNSGPLAGETSWEALGLPEEKTTVTHKVRRVGTWDPGLVADAVAANGGPPVVRGAVTMLDQVFPEVKGSDWDGWVYGDLPRGARAWLDDRSEEIGCPIDLVTVSDRTAVWRA